MRARFLIAILSLTGALLITHSATAHPLGNFSINHYSGIRIGRESIVLRYVIDMAEIPTFQEIQENGIVAQSDDPGVQAYLARKSEALSQGLVLEASGQRIPLNVESKEIIFPAGAGGLPTMKIGVVYRGEFEKSSGTHSQIQLNFRDGNFPGRAGWKEIVAVAEPGAKIFNSSVPERDRSSQLNNYPTDLLNSPPQETEARVSFAIMPLAAPVASAAGSRPVIGEVAAEIAAAKNPIDTSERRKTRRETHVIDRPETATEAMVYADTTQRTASDSESIELQANQQSTPRNAFTEVMSKKQLGLGMILIALLVAVGLGAFHALEPGHGKTLVAAYLVGSRGTMKHALLLGLIVTAAHTAGVYLLGAITMYASYYVIPERLYPCLGVVSGAMITTLGLVLLVRRYLGKDGLLWGDHHDHRHHSHNSDHRDDHGFGSRPHQHGHSHDPHEQRKPTSVRELLTLGISGGIVPCPAALVVLLSAVSMDRVGFGFLLIMAFSTGLALVLVGIGLLMVHARQFMSRFDGESRLTTRWLPLTSSAFITIFGLALTWQSIRSTGLIA